MGIPEVDAERRGGIEAGIHARQDEIFLRRREGQVALIEGRGILFRRGLEMLLVDGGRHGARLPVPGLMSSRATASLPLYMYNTGRLEAKEEKSEWILSYCILGPCARIVLSHNDSEDDDRMK